MSKEEYDKIPMVYCTQCLSLNIIAGDIDYCADCGSTIIGTVLPRAYGKLYYLVNNKFLRNGRIKKEV